MWPSMQKKSITKIDDTLYAEWKKGEADKQKAKMQVIHTDPVYALYILIARAIHAKLCEGKEDKAHLNR